MIQVTDAAESRLRGLLEEEGKLETHARRMKVVGGGCSGLRYELSFDDSTSEVDSEIDAGAVRLVVDEKSALYLVGTVLDFVDSLQESGFKIKNPNASNTCGCGDSFAA
jgi:iron-sulfur cluster assembly protein